MVMYRAVESLNLNENDGTHQGKILNKYAILEDSIKLYRQFHKMKKAHRSMTDNQLYDVRIFHNKNWCRTINSI